MRPSTPQPDSDLAASYETSDVNIRAVLWLAIGIIIGTAVVLAGLWLLLASFRAEAQRRQPTLSPLADLHQTPPAPQLQSLPEHDYQVFRAHEDELLRSYGWIDREKRITRIPIQRAMELIAERGEPTIPLPQPTTTAPQIPPAARDSTR
jgi:hypothetical protein